MANIDMVDLHQHSTYSVLDGFPDPDEIIEYAAKIDRQAVALTDHGSVSGHILFEKAVAGKGQRVVGANTAYFEKEALNVKPIYGIEAYTTSDVNGRGKEFQRKNHLTILAKNPTGYRNLLQLVTRSYEEGFYYKPSMDGDMLREHRDGLIILSGCETSSMMRAITESEFQKALELALSFKDIFGDDYYLECQHFPHMVGRDSLVLDLARATGIKPVLTCDCHYLESSDWRFQQFLWSIRDGKPIEPDSFKIELAHPWEPERLLSHLTQLNPTVPWDELMLNTCEIAGKVDRFQLPKAPLVKFPMEGDKMKYIAETCWRFLYERGLHENPKYIDRLVHELTVIAQKGYEDYFLVVADMVNWAKKQGIFVGPARGSSAGSVVCWALDITTIDPIHFGLMFERFVDPTRTDLPDIDMDFEDDRRDEVFAYMAKKYGEANVAFISTFARFGSKSALDDVARSFRIPTNEIETIKRHLVDRSSGDQRFELTIHDTLEEFPEARDIFARYPSLDIAAGIQGKIRHMGKHAAGLIVTSEPITDYMACYTAGEERLVAVDWRDATYLNLMKMDVLGLRELTIFRLICEKVGMTIDDLYKLPLDDAATIALFNAHDFLGIFQYTGLATKSVAGRVIFDSVEQIADVNALSRPGPLHAGATEAYIRGRAAKQFKPILPYPEVQPIIESTYGQIIYQEQVMSILRDVGGLEWQDVCDIRNVMGKSKGSEAFDKYWPKWLAGTAARGMPEAAAKEIWECIRLYGKHGFNKSHAVAYGIVAYWSAYMKVHYPTQFYWAQLVKSQGTQSDARIIQEALRKGIRFRPVDFDINHPTWWIDGHGSIVPGWDIIKGVGEKAAAELALHAPYAHMDDLTARVNKRTVNKGVREAVEKSIGLTVNDVYHLEQWLRVAELVPERVSISCVNETPTTAEYTIAGQIIKINKKNRIEEYKTKGKDISNLDPNADHDYVILIVEDETDSMMVYVSPSLYAVYKDDIWSKKDGFIRVHGKRTPGIQLILASEVTWL